MNKSEAQRQYTFCLSDLSKLNLQGDKGTDFTAWHRQWKSFSSLSGLDKEKALIVIGGSPELMFFERNNGYGTKPWTHQKRKRGCINNNKHVTEIYQ